MHSAQGVKRLTERTAALVCPAALLAGWLAGWLARTFSLPVHRPLRHYLL